MLRVQELLAGLDYLPLTYAQIGPAPALANLALDQPGSFAWRWPDQPAQLTSLWTQGTTNEITKAAIEAFENQNNLGVDGEAGPAVWTALINDTINHKTNPVPYVYVLVNKVVPQNLTLYQDGVGKYVGIPVNSGAPGADTTDGTYAVFEHVRYSDMKGTNPDGTTYNDPNVPYASYFNGGDALHGFIRASYGTPQSNGCIEMPYADAALVWPLTPIGTLVTIEGPNFGTAPPSTTTTSTSTTTTTTHHADDDGGARRPPRAPAATTHDDGTDGRDDAVGDGDGRWRRAVRRGCLGGVRAAALADRAAFAGGVAGRLLGQLLRARAAARDGRPPPCGGGARVRGHAGDRPRRRRRARPAAHARSTHEPGARRPPARRGRPAGTTAGCGARKGCAAPWSRRPWRAWRWPRSGRRRRPGTPPPQSGPRPTRRARASAAAGRPRARPPSWACAAPVGNP